MSVPIVVGFDPEGADDAPVHFGIVAARYTGAPLIVVAVQDWRPSEEAIDRVRTQLANDLDLRSEVRTVEAHKPAHGLTDALEQTGAGLAVVGATSRGAVGRAMVGSTADHVIHAARCPVAVVPHGYEGGEVRAVGVAYTPTDEGREALHSGVVLAHTAGAKLRVITVLHEEAGTLGPQIEGARAMQALPEEFAAQHHAAGRAAVDEAIAEQGAKLDAEVELVYGDPADALLPFTGSLDVLVMGSRAHAPRRAVMLGGVSRKVIAGSKCPVLVLPRGAEHPLRALIESRGDAQSRA